MRSLILSTLCLSLVSGFASAKDKAKGLPVPFPGLTTFVISGDEAALPEQISYDPTITKLINQPMEQEKGAEEAGISEMTRLISTKVNRESDARQIIYYDPGPSADPSFVITDEKTNTRIGVIAGDALIVPGNGFIYSIARTNNMHEERQKFEVKDGKIVEIKQPFSYVGLNSKSRVPLTLTAEKDGKEVVAQLPKGESLQVVLRDGDYLLIKTPFGLIGWMKLKTDVTADTAEIEGIYFAGD